MIETPAFVWKDHSRDGEGSERYGMYAGAFEEEGTINVEAMDLLTYPGWSTLEWWDVQLEPGECLFLPLG